MKRIDSIDIVRGLVMVIMALDHTRDYLHVSSLTGNPLDLETTTPVLFFSRWITHLCAPVFVFLSGTSAYISMKNRNNLRQSRNFLLTRGLWLILLEFTVVSFALWFDIHFRLTLFQVIAAIGSGFIILALVMKLPTPVLGIISLMIIFGHGLLSQALAGSDSLLRPVLSPLINFSTFQLTPDLLFVIAYPLIPWFGIMLAGFASGRLFERQPEDRRRLFLRIGLAALALFIIIRLADSFGDPSIWSIQKNFLYTLLSFVNTSKYPPSLLFTLMTLGVMFLLLAITEGIRNRITGIMIIYGKVPFFYFLVHLYLIHSFLLVILFLQGFRWDDLSFAPFTFGRPEGAESGVALWAVFLIWLGVVAALYPLCRWYGDYKFTRKEKKWLRFL